MPILNIGAQHTKQTVDQAFIQIAMGLDAVNRQMTNLAQFMAQQQVDDLVTAFGVDAATAQQYLDGAAMLGQVPQTVLANITGIGDFIARIRPLT